MRRIYWLHAVYLKNITAPQKGSVEVNPTKYRTRQEDKTVFYAFGTFVRERCVAILAYNVSWCRFLVRSLEKGVHCTVQIVQLLEIRYSGLAQNWIDLVQMTDLFFLLILVLVLYIKCLTSRWRFLTLKWTSFVILIVLDMRTFTLFSKAYVIYDLRLDLLSHSVDKRHFIRGKCEMNKNREIN